MQKSDGSCAGNHKNYGLALICACTLAACSPAEQGPAKQSPAAQAPADQAPAEQVESACTIAKQSATRDKTMSAITIAESLCTDVRWVGDLQANYVSWNGQSYGVTIPYPDTAIEAGFINYADIGRLMNHKTIWDLRTIFQDLFGNRYRTDNVPQILEADVPNSHPYKSFLPEALSTTVRVDTYFSNIEYPHKDLHMISGNVVYTLLTSEPPDKVIILVQGHANEHLTQEAIYFLEHGFSVILRGMPGFLDDYIVHGGERFTDGHDGFYELESDDFNPMALFIEPNILAVDLAASTHPNARIYIAGISGGALMALLTHAFDKRISASMSVSGWKPFFLRYRSGLENFEGDYEQNTNRFYRRHSLNYLDLVDLATRDGGRHYQVWVVGDTSAFGGDGYISYANQLSTITKNNYRLILDPVSTGHTIEICHLDAFMSIEFGAQWSGC